MGQSSKSRSRHGWELTLGDRLVTGFIGGILTFSTVSVLWLLTRFLAGQYNNDLGIPFSWVWIITGVGALASSTAGPVRTMDAFQKIWEKLFSASEDVHREYIHTDGSDTGTID